MENEKRILSEIDNYSDMLLRDIGSCVSAKLGESNEKEAFVVFSMEPIEREYERRYYFNMGYVEILGGKLDGAKVLPGFVFDIKAFEKKFDEIEQVTLDCAVPGVDISALGFRGTYKGKKIVVYFGNFPIESTMHYSLNNGFKYNVMTSEYILVKDC